MGSTAKPEPMADMQEYVTMFGGVLPQVNVKKNQYSVIVDKAFKIEWVGNGYYVDKLVPVTGGGYQEEPIAKFSFYDAFRFVAQKLFDAYVDATVQNNIMSHDPGETEEHVDVE